MPTQKKIDQVQALEEKLRRCTIAISTEFRLNVAEMVELRRRLRSQEIEYMVVKNTLAGIAADNVGQPGLREILRGPTALAFGYGDPVDPARALAEHIRASRVNLTFSGAIADGQVMSGADVQRLATIPPRPVLMGQMMGNLLAPLNGLVYAVTYHIGGLARVLDARQKQLEEAGAVPADSS